MNKLRLFLCTIGLSSAFLSFSTISATRARAQGKGKGPSVTISSVLDAGSYTATVAQGSVFVIKGSGLSVSGYAAATAPSYPTTLNGVKISFLPVAGGSPTDALMVYTYNVDGVNQLAAVLPSTTPPGDYDVRVTNGTLMSAAIRTEVVAHKPAIITANGGGSGLAQATLGGGPTLQRFADVGSLGPFDTRPARTGERVDLWLTGLGPDALSDSGGTSGDQTAANAVRVIVDGTDIVPLYAGRSQGFPGLDQVVFILPESAPLDCFVTVQVRAGGASSIPVTLATASGPVCSHPMLGQSALSRLSSGQSVTGAYFILNSGVREFPGTLPGASGSVSEALRGGVGSFASDLTNVGGNAGIRGVRPLVANIDASLASGCTVFRQTGPYSSLDQSQSTVTGGLNAGTLRLTRPNSSQQQLSQVGFSYSANFGDGRSVTILPGLYRLTGGGLSVGTFEVPLTVPSFEWTNRHAITSVKRNQPLSITWTGGGAGWVTVIGFSGLSVAGSSSITLGDLDGTNFVCTAPANAGTLTVPVSVLGQLPPVAVTVTGDQKPSADSIPLGVLSVIATGDIREGAFSASLAAGGTLDFGLFNYVRSYVKVMSYE